MIVQNLAEMKAGISMANNIYFYTFKNIDKLMDLVTDYDSVSIKEHSNFIECNVEVYKKEIQKLSKQSISLYTKSNIIKFIIINKFSIIAVITEKYSYIKNFYDCEILNKINLLDNRIFKSILDSKFSDNLVKLNMSTLSLDAVIDEVELIGNKLQYSEVLYNFNSYILDDETRIYSYSFEPINYKFIANVSSMNKIEIRNKSINLDEIMYFTYDFINKVVDSGGIYG